MLLAIDAGNSNLTLGVFEGPRLGARWRLRTVHEKTADEWGVKLRQLFELGSIPWEKIKGIVIASVVPPIDASLAEMARRYFNQPALFVAGDTKTGLTVRVDNPREVGADRIVNAVAALAKYGGPAIVVDLGTAITFDAVSAQAEYVGGVICPGIGMSVSGLFHKTARLPMVAFGKPDKLIGTDTVGSMQSGLFYGVVSMIDGIAERMIGEMGPQTRIVATGGQASLVTHPSKFIKTVDEDLTLEGLRLIWELNRR